MPKKCLLLLLDGLGDRSHETLEGQTPLQAAPTPTFDALAAKGGCGLYHAARVGMALPSELAHFLLFGYPLAQFPGRGALEALGAGITLFPDDVALMARLVHVAAQGQQLRLMADTPAQITPEETAELAASLPELACEGIALRYRHIKGLHGLLLLSPSASIPDERITDTNPIRDGAMLIEPRPLREAGDTTTAQRTAKALKRYLLQTHAHLDAHPVNQERRQKGLPPCNALATQRAGRLRPLRSFCERYGLRGACVASGGMYRGLARHLGLEFTPAQEPAKDDADPAKDLAARIELARDALKSFDFVHLHTKAPDVAAHTKDCLRKRDVIAALDVGARPLLDMADDPELLLAVTADHSTPSCGGLIHSGEPVPLLLHGQGVRRDAVAHYDEISCASGCLGLMRGDELMLMLLNHLDKSRLAGLRDSPEAFDALPSWPGPYTPFTMD